MTERQPTALLRQHNQAPDARRILLLDSTKSSRPQRAQRNRSIVNRIEDSIQLISATLAHLEKTVRSTGHHRFVQLNLQCQLYTPSLHPRADITSREQVIRAPSILSSRASELRLFSIWTCDQKGFCSAVKARLRDCKEPKAKSQLGLQMPVSVGRSHDFRITTYPTPAITWT
jgi:hypothetical protein